MNNITVEKLQELCELLDYREVEFDYEEKGQGEKYFHFDAYTDDNMVLEVAVRENGETVVYDRYVGDKHSVPIVKANLVSGEWKYEYI
jgi:hypothetical protein